MTFIQDFERNLNTWFQICILYADPYPATQFYADQDPQGPQPCNSVKYVSVWVYAAVLRIRIRIRIHRIHVFLGLLDPDPLVTGVDPDPDPALDPDPDPSIIMQK